MLIVALWIGASAADTITLASGAALSGRLTHYEAGGTCTIQIEAGDLTGADVVIGCDHVVRMERTASTLGPPPAEPVSETAYAPTMSGGAEMLVEDPAPEAPIAEQMAPPLEAVAATGTDLPPEPVPTEAPAVEVVNGSEPVAPESGVAPEEPAVGEPEGETLVAETEPLPEEEAPVAATSPSEAPKNRALGTFEFPRLKIIDP